MLTRNEKAGKPHERIDPGFKPNHRHGAALVYNSLPDFTRSCQGTGVRVTVVRPGFVHSRMTRGMKSAPFATTPRVVGELAVAGMRHGRHTVWTPGILRYVFSILRHVPRPIFRRLPLG